MVAVPGLKPGLESSCDQKTEDEVLSELADIAARNPGKLLVSAAHHPLRSHGIHGGYYKLKQHIFPLTDARPFLYLPLPVIGSVYPLVRGVFGTREDLPHPLYKRMIAGIEEAMPRMPPWYCFRPRSQPPADPRPRQELYRQRLRCERQQGEERGRTPFCHRYERVQRY